MLRRTRAAGLAAAVAAGLALAAPTSADDEIARAIAAIKAVGREGKNNDDAGPAWKALVGKGGPALLPTLEAVDDTNPTAANWLRTAAGAIAEAEEAAGRKLPPDRLEGFVRNAKHAASARRLAYELLVKQDPVAKDRLLAGFLDDPSPELRRDAVAAGLDRIGKGDGPAQKPQLAKLFAVARDQDQVEELARRLEKAGEKVSIPEHFGYVSHWHLVGPFDSAQGKALTLSHPPEAATAPTGTFKGKGGTEVGWKFQIAKEVIRGSGPKDPDRYAVVDLNEPLGKHHDAAGYALAVVSAEKETPCDIRVATPNAVQIFLNGQKLFEREEYHHGAPMDHHVGKGVLKPGPNAVLLKVCQNNQKDEWAQNWMFQLRVCDATGGPLPGVVQLLPDKDPPARIKLGHFPADKKEEKK